jgi:hypothetical protein
MLGVIKVVNIKTFDSSRIDGEVFNIMRPSILGNPFKMEDESDREIVVRSFYHYLRKEFTKKEEVFNELKRLTEIVKSGKDLFLVCCCAPKSCHGDIIKNAIEGIINYESRNS